MAPRIDHRPMMVGAAGEGVPMTVGPLPVQMPGVTIQLSDDVSPHKLREQMHAIAQVMNPGMYEPPPAMGPHEDAFGTPLEWMELPSIFDAADKNREAIRMKHVSPMSMICMRMKWGMFSDPGPDSAGFMMPQVPFEHISVHLTKEVAIVFIVSKGEPVTIKDDANIFPSDALVTQLRMLEEASK